MLLFKRRYRRKILAGKKTATRRFWKKQHVNVNSIQQAKTGYRKEDKFARLLILKVYQQRLGDMTEQDAIDEGCKSLEEYKQEVIDLEGKWDPDAMPFVIKFNLWDELRGGTV